MRIIAGEFRGRKLLPPVGSDTRPITDRVKQSLFDILTPHIEGARVYDCFAGTGSMGLESLSRGADHVTFFESDRSAVQLMRKNIEALKVADRSIVIPGDLFAWFDSRVTGYPRVSLVFLDPPYRFLRDQADALRRLAGQIVENHLARHGIVVFRHDSQDRLELPPLVGYDQREYGGMTIELLKAP